MKKKAIAILIILFTIQIQSQTVESILKKSTAVYLKKSYKVAITYSVYKGVTGNNLLKSYNGQFIKNEKDLYNKIKSTEFISRNNDFIKVNHTEKALVYSKKPLEENNSFEMNFDKITANFDFGTLTDKNGFWYCELTPKKQLNLPYNKVVFVINKKTFISKKQLLFISKKINFSKTKKDLDFVRMEIEFSDFKSITNEDIKLLNINNYVTNLDSNPTLTKKYQDYNLIK